MAGERTFVAWFRTGMALVAGGLAAARLLEQDRTQHCVIVMHDLGRYYDARPYLDDHNTRLLYRIREEVLEGGYHGHRDALAQARQLSAYLAADASSAPG
jgi:hypothetical protein